MTTNVLKDLEGKTTVSRQYVEDLLKRPTTKQAEADIINKVLKDYPEGKIPVDKFANDVKSELLPLTRYDLPSTKFDRVSLPDGERGAVSNYQENIYQSPIKTSAGNTHFGGEPNYFAHTRVEDLADPGDWVGKAVDPNTGMPIGTDTSTRRVIEIQSDLFQKGNLEKELQHGLLPFSKQSQIPIEQMRNNGWNEAQIQRAIEESVHSERKSLLKRRKEEIKPLKPYENTWHERVIREEVKKAAEDGKTKLQFPTGETAMKIEGLGDVNRDNWMVHNAPGDYTPIGVLTDSPIRMRPGNIISSNGDEWVITKNLGDGKFRAIHGLVGDNEYDIYQKIIQKRKPLNEVGDLPSLTEIKDFTPKELEMLDKYAEQFDISSKVDTSSPIYKFYESEVGKYLQKKYDAKKIIDPQGVPWWQINISPSHGKMPVNALSKKNEDNNYGLPPISIG